MIEMAMGQQHLVQTLESNTCAQDLALRPLTAIHQEAEFFMLNK
jgi:hypothetical protein